jgi:hypothetical protein
VAKHDLVGGSGLPVGTVDEIRAMGQALVKWGSCSARDANLKSRGCNHEPNCIFAFKGLPIKEGGGPRKVIVYIKPDTGAKVERPMPCYVYMETLHKRAMAEGSGETIAVVGHEGDTYECRETVSVSPHGGPAKNDNRMKSTTSQKVCPAFPRPGEEGSAMGPEFLSDQKIEAKLKDNQRILRQLRSQGVEVADLVGMAKKEQGEASTPAGPGKRG